jgi:hypothetical protein
MSPLPTTKTAACDGIVQATPVPLSKRGINWNPLHYGTLPFKNNWDKVAPILDKYNNYTRTIGIILGAIGLVITLDQHNWKLPRWPWAKDGLNNPRPSEIHPNERMTADDLAEKKLLDMLKEMKMHEEDDDILWEDGLPEDSAEVTESETEMEAEEQFMEDADVGVGDIIQEMEGSNI